ncbi:3'-5' exonuclease [Tengunoibacter tsumagoiensis]|uniref:Exonuclease n=1 Tax=Tengunoibacter tsumagoiensis TaxID=2014871 RepID=A0A401ZXK2_9CHLR|nr:3'-5' exonuclease [Tengunoibacter tsumagoiensis]GCE11565.1 exonuclease [Tengunoibacter tsumagoiensis]
MKKLLDVVLVIDIEATCWDGAVPEGQENEIIEIGICPFEVSTHTRGEKRSLLIRPERSVVSPFCTKLTTLTQEQVDGGISFAEACNILRTEYASKERVWASWGDYDRIIIEQQCLARKIEYPFNSRHLNLKTVFALLHALPREIGMMAALKMAQLTPEGTHHRGDDDAWNTAALLKTILQKIPSEEELSDED